MIRDKLRGMRWWPIALRTANKETSSTRWLLPFLASLVAVLATILSSATASAAITGMAETRVRASSAGDALVEPPERIAAGQRIGEAGAQPGIVVASGVAANAGSKALRSVDDVMADGGTLLRGKSPAEVESILKDTPGWRVEGLGQGSAQGRGWMMREYTERGNPTGRMIRWHPGGGHHGPDPYWRVVGYEGDLFGIIR